MTKFQLQMSGMWNQKVLERESAVVGTGVSPASLTATDWGSEDWEDPLALTSSSSLGSGSSSAVDSTTTTTTTTAATPLYNEYGFPVMEIPQELDTPSPRRTVQVTGSSSSTYERESAAAPLPTQPFYPYQELSTAPPLPSSLPIPSEEGSSSIGEDIEVSKVLEELDRDYQALRRKLVNVILTVERKASSITAASTSATSSFENTTDTSPTVLAVAAVAKLTDDIALESVVSINSVSGSSSGSGSHSDSPNRKLYWPPLVKRREH